jgi:hypothetical protein
MIHCKLFIKIRLLCQVSVQGQIDLQQEPLRRRLLIIGGPSENLFRRTRFPVTVCIRLRCNGTREWKHQLLATRFLSIFKYDSEGPIRHRFLSLAA